MIDIDKIKPGDKLAWHGSELHWPWIVNGVMVNHVTKPGDVVTVSDPAAYVDSSGYELVRVALRCGTIVARSPDRLMYYVEAKPRDAVESQNQCFCDIMSLMRVGCQCGYMAHEREANR